MYIKLDYFSFTAFDFEVTMIEILKYVLFFIGENLVGGNGCIT